MPHEMGWHWACRCATTAKVAVAMVAMNEMPILRTATLRAPGVLVMVRVVVVVRVRIVAGSPHLSFIHLSAWPKST